MYRSLAYQLASLKTVGQHREAKSELLGVEPCQPLIRHSRSHLTLRGIGISTRLAIRTRFLFPLAAKQVGLGRL